MSRTFRTLVTALSGALWLAAVGCGGGSNSAGSGCSTDIECKGDRVCVAGACVDPNAARADGGLSNPGDSGTVYSGGRGGSATAGSGGAIDDPELERACSLDCEARKGAGCEMDVGSLDQCLAQCLVIDESTQGYCLDEMTARYACSASGGYTCVSGYPQPKATCIAEGTALSACNQLTPCRSYCDHLPEDCNEAGDGCVDGCMEKQQSFEDALCSIYFNQLLTCWSRDPSCQDGIPTVGNCGPAVAEVGRCISRRNHVCDGYCWAAETLGCAADDCATACRTEADAASCGNYYRRVLDCAFDYGSQLSLSCVDGTPTIDPTSCASEIQQYDECKQAVP